MPVDGAKAGNVAVKIIGRLKERFADHEDARVRTAMLIDQLERPVVVD